MTDWTPDKEKKIMWKYRFLLTARILRVIIILLFLYGVYMMLISIGSHKFGNENKHEFQMNLAIDWTQMGIYGEFEPHPGGEVTPFLSQKLTIPIYRTIGKEEQPIGNMYLTKRIITPFSTKKIDYFSPSDAQRFNFYLPEDPRTGKKLVLSQETRAWEALEKVHEGTVADLAFSTKRFYDSEELLELLDEYDLDVIWMPLYAGELKEIENVGYTMAGSTYLSVETFGLSRAKDTEDYRSYMEIRIGKENIKENEALMLKNMKKLLDGESKAYIEDFLGLRFLEERYNYLKDNGFQVYGAVVTGPVKELLKLKELEELQGAQLGEFEYWNWEQ